ncbi:MAG: RNA polymerase sigma factor [Betaproteobacteria bacterium]
MSIIPLRAPLEFVASTLPLSDAQLAARAERGDALAFEIIVRRHNRLLFRTARGVVADDAEAQDVVQETYLRAFEKLHTFRADARLGTWLARIAINVALDAMRKKGRAVNIADDHDLMTEPVGENLMAFNAPLNDTPDNAAQRNQVRKLLQQAIEELPEKYRVVFILRAVEELSVEETASCLDVSLDVVKTRYLRARSMLRDVLNAQVESLAQEVFAFAGTRCDAVVAHVMADLQRRGYIHSG